MKTVFSRSLMAVCLALIGSAQAQDYTLDWFTLDGGGGVSSGGIFAVSGTVGQPDAGMMAGGAYSLAVTMQ